MICAPSRAASRISCAPFSTFFSVSAEKFIWTRAALAVAMLASPSFLAGYRRHARNDLPAIRLDNSFGIFERRVHVEFRHSDRLEFAKLLRNLAEGAEHGKAIDDLVRNVVVVLRLRAGVLSIVVVRTRLDVVRDVVGNLFGIVVPENVRDVVAHERREPPELCPRLVAVVGRVAGGRHLDLESGRVPPFLLEARL